jgi:hypothetical protein
VAAKIVSFNVLLLSVWVCHEGAEPVALGHWA